MGYTALGCALIAAALVAAAGHAAAQPNPPPAEDFTRLPRISNVVLSPSGQRLAMVWVADGGRPVAAVMDLPPTAPPRVVAAFHDVDVVEVGWVNDDRLVFDVAEQGYRISADGMGTYAVDHDGQQLRELIASRTSNPSKGSRIQSRVLTRGWSVLRSLDDGSSDVIVSRRFTDSRGDRVNDTLSRLDTRTGLITGLGAGIPSGAGNWVFDARNEPRVVRVSRDGRDKLYWRDPTGEAWVLIEDSATLEGDALVPVYLETDHQLVVYAKAGRDTEGYYIYDLKARKLDPEPLVALANFDAAGQLEFDTRTRRLLGVHLRTERPVSVWFDAGFATVQKSLDAALPAGRFNRIHCGRCETSAFFVVESSSDRQPAEFHLFDRRQGRLQALQAARPWLNESAQGQRTYHRVSARDGLPLPVYVTHPTGRSTKEALPAVVLVHGGPWVRGSDLRWHSDAQFLASRGYRVIEPEFRGSTGYGWRLFRAGWKQWGLAMQDDLADTVQWAAAAGLIDPKRVCIYGGSYGGYAALMAPIRHPGLFRCSASFAAVTDIDLMYTADSDLTIQTKRYSMPTLIGDRQADAQLLRDSSPLQRVAELKLPVLLAHGGQDRRVPVEHADKFVRAAERAGVAIERVDYPHEGHGWYSEENHADFLKRLERFLARSLMP